MRVRLGVLRLGGDVFERNREREGRRTGD